MAARVLLFDLDGVLVDSRASVERHWRSWAGAHGLPWDPIAAIVHGQRSVDTIRDVAPWLDAEREAAALDRTQAADTHGVVAVSHAAELLGALPARGWAVVTSGRRELAAARLAGAGLPAPPVLVGADDVARGKPFPDGYLCAARLLGVPPERCIVVEDAPTGVEAALAAGMEAVALGTTHAATELRRAARLAGSLREIAAELAAAAGVQLRTAGGPPGPDGG
jgi:mannitol-1-/sugar-/sorbitol-6-phosphatase